MERRRVSSRGPLAVGSLFARCRGPRFAAGDALRRPLALLALAVCLPLASCGTQGGAHAPVYLRVAGTNAMPHLLRELTAAYSAQQPQVSFDLQGGDSQTGLDLLQEGMVDISASSWPPSTEALEAAEQAGNPLRLTTVAQDGLVLVVHPKNPVSDLSMAQIRALFSGHVPDWRELGGRVGDVMVISREDGAGDRAMFEALVMDRQPVTLGAIVMPNSRDVIEYVAGHPNAIGYVSIGEITPDVKPLAIDGVAPTTSTIIDGSYALWRHLVLLTKNPPSDDVKEFLGFVTAASGQAVVAGYYEAVR